MHQQTRDNAVGSNRTVTVQSPSIALERAVAASSVDCAVLGGANLVCVQ